MSWLTRRPKIARRRFFLEPLEERIVLDATVAVDPVQPVDSVDIMDDAGSSAGTGASSGGPDHTQIEQGVDSGDQAGNSDPSIVEAVSSAGDGSSSDQAAKVLVVSSNVAHADVLAAAAKEGVITVVYDGTYGTLEGLSQTIRDALGSNKACLIAFAVHDMGEARFHLVGEHSVTLGSLLGSSEIQDFWKDVGALVTEGGRLDILSCNLASSDAGGILVSQLEAVTGRNVAASTDATGNSASGGDWILETDDVDAGDAYFDSAVLVDFQGTLMAERKIAAADAVTGNQFGYSTAISASGAYAIVGAWLDDDRGTDAGAAYLFIRSGSTWTLQSKVTASDGAAGDMFGRSVAITASYAVVGAYGDDVGSNVDQGSAYVFLRSGSAWFQQAKLTSSDGEAGDNFGFSVAVSTAGDYAAIGAYGDDVGGDVDQGSAYVFLRSGTAWSQQAKVTADDYAAGDGSAGDNFGRSVAIGPGTTSAGTAYALIVGADGDDVGLNADQGSAYLFRRNGTSWTYRIAKITAADGAAGDHFGMSVGIFHNSSTSTPANDDYAIIGAPFADVSGLVDAGKAYTYRHTGADTTWTWAANQTLQATDPNSGDYFGWSVGMAPSALAAVVGAYGDDGAAVDRGSAYVFVRSGTAWSQQGKLISAGGSADDRLGFSTAIYYSDTADDFVLAGAFSDDVGAGSDSGAVYSFMQSATGVWASTPQVKLAQTDAASGDSYGYSVAISSTGAYAIVGVYSNDDLGTDAGAAYIYSRSGTTWSQQARITAADGSAYDYFGASVSISDSYAVVGAYGDDEAFVDQGSAYVFLRSTATWTQQAKLTASDAAAYDFFGFSTAVSNSGDFAIAGAYGADIGGNLDQGAAYVFGRSGTTWSQQGKLTATGGASGDNFGYDVALSGLAEAAAVGAPGYDNGASQNQGAAYVFLRTAADWTTAPTATQILASDGAGDDRFGHSVGIYYLASTIATTGDDYVIVGSPWADLSGKVDAGKAYTFSHTGADSPWTWTQNQILQASDSSASDYFGYDVALAATAGDAAVIGAYGDDTSTTLDHGSAYVFTRSGSAWSQQAKVTAADYATGNRLGASVALYYSSSADDWAILGAPGDDIQVEADAGSAYVYRHTSGTTWSLSSKTTAKDLLQQDYFGTAVAISGNYAIVGSYLDDDRGANVGAVYIYSYDGTNWVLDAKLTPSDGAASDYFGRSVAISGNYAVVGSYQDDDKGSASGSVYVFELDGTGNWVQKSKLVASDGAASDYFGWSVSIDGDYLAVGAYQDDDMGTNSGSVYVFERDGSGNWVERSKLVASDGAASDYFGYDVAIDGDYVVVGSYYDDDKGTNSGSAYVFERDGSGNWVQRSKLVASDGAASDYFGISVAVSGNYAVVGSYQDDDKGSNSGSAYMFQRDVSGNWAQQTKLVASDGAASDYYGFSVSISGDYAVVGSYQDDDKGSNSGSAYVYYRNPTSGTWSETTKVVATDGAAGDNFGYAAATSDTYTIIGAYLDDEASLDSGSAYIYDHSNAQLTTNSQINQTRTYTEGAASVAISDIVVTDTDPGERVTATLTLNLPSAGSLTTSGAATYNSVTGIWTVTGTVSAVNTALANVSFVPTSNNDLDTTISVSIYDGGEGGTVPKTGTITLDVTPVNDAPVLDNSGAPYLTAINENQTDNPGTKIADLIARGAGGDPITDVDSGAPEGIAVVAADTAYGSWEFTTNGSTWSTLGSVSGTAARLLSADANTAIRFVPNSNWYGSIADAITFRAWDKAQGTNGGTWNITAGGTGGSTAFSTLTETASITVNRAPTAGDNDYTTSEDTALTVSGPGVLGNDSDVEGDPLTAVLVTGPSHGTLTLNANGSFAYTPSANYNGTDSFTYKANDGASVSNIATVSITVTSVNDAPTAGDNGYTTSEDTALTVSGPGVLGNDSDVDGDPLTAVLVTGPSHGTLTLNANGSFTYTPGADYNGTDSFTYKANDGASDSNTATVSITVTSVNDAPTAGDDGYTTSEDTAVTVSGPGVMGNDSDIEGDPLTAVLVTGPSHGTLTLNANGSFTYTPTANYNGTDSFTYKANDGASDSNTATVSLMITEVNDSPYIDRTEIPTVTAEEGRTSNVFVLTAHDVDLPDGGEIHFVVEGQVVSHSTPFSLLLSWGELTAVSGVHHDGSGTYSQQFSVTAYDNGEHGLAVSARDDDGGFSGSATLSLRVANVAPVLTSQLPDIDSIEGSATAAINLRDYFSDVARDTPSLEFVYDDGDGHSGVVDDPERFSLSYGQNGSYTVTLTARDKDGGVSAQASFLATVSNVAPVQTDALSDVSIPVGSETRPLNLTDLFTDVAADLPLSFTYEDAAGGMGPVADPTAFTLTYASAGVYTVTITAEDVDGGRLSASFTVTVFDAGNGSDAATEGTRPEVAGSPIRESSIDEAVPSTAVEGLISSLVEVSPNTPSIEVSSYTPESSAIAFTPLVDFGSDVPTKPEGTPEEQHLGINVPSSQEEATAPSNGVPPFMESSTDSPRPSGPPPTGLHGYAEAVKKGAALVFNLEEIYCAALCMPSWADKNDEVEEEDPLSLSSEYYEAVRAGKALVFDFDPKTLARLWS